METMIFGVKRAFYATLNITRPVLAGFGLTPARYDVLYAIVDADTQHGVCPQRSLWRVLGVARSTISKLLRNLEELGLVRRERWSIDRRQRYVSLTALGRVRLQRAHRSLVLGNHIPLAVESALREPPWILRVDANEVEVRAEPDIGDQRRTFIRLLDRLRWQFRDHATFKYRQLQFRSPLIPARARA
jgi:DNA-binding MarR family transcriptional regulator